MDDLQADQHASALGEIEANGRGELGQVEAVRDVKLGGEVLAMVEASTCMGEASSVETAGLNESTSPCLR
jgi:hypothetical protein